MEAAQLFLELFLSVVGMAYFVYGKKSGHAVALLSGMVLMIFPYFVSNIWAQLAIGVGLAAAPFVLDFGD